MLIETVFTVLLPVDALDCYRGRRMLADGIGEWYIKRDIAESLHESRETLQNDSKYFVQNRDSAEI